MGDMDAAERGSLPLSGPTPGHLLRANVGR